MAQRAADHEVRQAQDEEIEALAELWYQGWQDAHAAILPAELARLRTRESFRQRLRAALPAVRVVGSPGAPLGFCMTKGDELHQLFVSPDGRGRGIAGLLEADAVSMMSGRGTRTAWLACAIGNDRAARFYEKAGWRRMGTVVSPLETREGSFPLEVWRYEKSLEPLRR
jgi:GNAT superfamily N-acetyltransferase